MRLLPALLLLFAALLICGCRDTTPVATPAPPAPSPTPTSSRRPDARPSDPNTRFGLKLLRECVRADRRGNAVISPLGLGLALGMLYNGAGTTTRDAIADVLEVRGLPAEDVNCQYADLLKASLGADPKVTLRIANALWADDSFIFAPAFLNVTRGSYQAEAFALDLQSPTAEQTLNDWVAGKTNGQITRAVELGRNPMATEAAVLMDAVYLKALWQHKFDDAATKFAQFRVSVLLKRQIQMMEQEGEFSYFETPDLQAVSLPYASGRLCFDVYLPAAGSSLNALCASLTPQVWSDWTSRFATRQGYLRLPRFRVESEVDLDSALKRLGMRDAYAEGRHDFAPMGSAAIWLDRSAHRTVLHVHEEGTDAAAVTVLYMCLCAGAASPGAFEMVVDRPFLCTIRDAKTGAILFLAAIRDPGISPPPPDFSTPSRKRNQWPLEQP